MYFQSPKGQCCSFNYIMSKKFIICNFFFGGGGYLIFQWPSFDPSIKMFVILYKQTEIFSKYITHVSDLNERSVDQT